MSCYPVFFCPRCKSRGKTIIVETEGDLCTACAEVVAAEARLRDSFAAAALTGLLASSDPLSSGRSLSVVAWEIADGMMRERARRAETKR